MAREAIFIGYRRDDTADVAGRIYDALVKHFGRNRLFKDVDNLRPGVQFGAHIRSILPSCRVVLVLIGPNWVSAQDANGLRRLDDPNDWVRIEIETALGADDLDVVPVLVNGAQMPRVEDLPESLRPLLDRHAAAIRRDPDFHDDVTRLARVLREHIRGGALDLAGIGGKQRKRDGGTGVAVGGLVLLAGAAFALFALGVIRLPTLEAAKSTLENPPPSGTLSTPLREVVNGELLLRGQRNADGELEAVENTVQHARDVLARLGYQAAVNASAGGTVKVFLNPTMLERTPGTFAHDPEYRCPRIVIQRQTDADLRLLTYCAAERLRATQHFEAVEFVPATPMPQ